jgi:hypothetical protein
LTRRASSGTSPVGWSRMAPSWPGSDWDKHQPPLSALGFAIPRTIVSRVAGGDLGSSERRQ